MEIVQVVIAFFKANWVEILAIIGAIDLILGIVSKWTPTKIDDNIYAFIHKYIEKLVSKKS